MGYETFDLLNQLGSPNVVLLDIERRLVDSLGLRGSREDEASSIEGILTDYRATNLGDAARYEEKVGTTPELAELYRRFAQGFRDSAERTKALLDRLARNPNWP